MANSTGSGRSIGSAALTRSKKVLMAPRRPFGPIRGAFRNEWWQNSEHLSVLHQISNAQSVRNQASRKDTLVSTSRVGPNVAASAGHSPCSCAECWWWSAEPAIVLWPFPNAR